ncbi:cache domain-containing protein [Desulfogranum japonicum]|uniref:cache domain-containing protein n=1 Tax=Desulfogranum japonicum TaxID=231447 RepID=UPI0004249229|nr:cache domain-containing protein [Desulfogranum japonicum]
MSGSGENTSKKRGLTIFHKILFTMVIVALIPFGGLWYISLFKAKQDWEASTYQSLKRQTLALTGRIDEWAEMNLKIMDQNSRLEDIQSMDAGRQNPVLKSITDTYDYIYLSFVVDANGKSLGRSDDKPAIDYSDRSYYKQVLIGKDLGQQVLMGRTSDKPALVLARPITHGRKLGGAIAMAMSLDNLSETIANVKIGDTGYVTLVDGNNRLIAQGKGDVSGKLQDMSEHPVLRAPKQIQQDGFIFDYNGTKIVSYKYETNLGWTLIVQQDYSEAFSAADASQRQSLVLLVVTMLMVLLIAWILARRLSGPIQNLTRIADEISMGKLDATINETKRRDEIGDLAQAIERMGVSLQMAFDRLRKKK